MDHMPSKNSGKRTVETRWLIVAEDGRHVTVGRLRDPDERDLERSAAVMDGLGLAAWLVLGRGDFGRATEIPELWMVRRLTRRDGTWKSAADLWRELHQQRNAAQS